MSLPLKQLFIVYLAQHPTAGSYVGSTRQGISSRRSAHHTKAKSNSPIPFHLALKETNFVDWTWDILHVVWDVTEVLRLERLEIESRKPNLNIRYNAPEGYVHHNTKKKGNWKVTEETREWFRNFHSTRPRKRTLTPSDVLYVQVNPDCLTQWQLADRFGVTQSHISRIRSERNL